MQAKDLMKSPVIAVSTETPLREAARLLSEHKISGVLVTGARGPVGVVSLSDMVTFMAGLERPAGEPGGFYRTGFPRLQDGNGWSDTGWERVDEEPISETPVGEIMATEILTVAHDTPLKDVARIMLKQGIHRVFVDEDGRLVGVISTMDVMRACIKAAPARAPRMKSRTALRGR